MQAIERAGVPADRRVVSIPGGIRLIDLKTLLDSIARPWYVYHSMKKRPSIRQIAEACGVSQMTASRALRGEGPVAESTRHRVLEAAKRLQYRPNRLVRAVLGGRTGTVGLMIPLGSWFLAEVVRGVHDTLAKSGYLPVIHFHGDGPGADRDESELDYIHRLIEQRVDGIIFTPSDESVPDVYLREVWDRGLPLVSIDRKLPRTQADFSGTDDEAGGGLVARHLLALGHRRLGHISGEPWISTYLDRRRGFEAEIVGNPGIEYAFAACQKSDARAAALAMLSSDQRPTAIFAGSDKMAAGVYAAAEELGLQIGPDVAVVGFADLLEYRHLRPQLTTVNQQPVTIGANAASLILDRLSGRSCPSGPRVLRTEPRLVVRESTASSAR
jgi:DNA-binding LacI/PurR family transcriptional regulator